jgi:nucleotide-binding universal stress UspA family protein
MTFKQILVHVDSTPASRMRLEVAAHLARRFGARLLGLHVIPEPEVPPYFKPSRVPKIAEIFRSKAEAAAERAGALFRDEMARMNMVGSWQCLAGDLTDVISERSRFADLVILGQFDTENPRGVSAFLLSGKVVCEAAAPILVVPNDGRFSKIGERILLAWDGSLEAARAVHNAIPLLQSAARVTVLTLIPLRKVNGCNAPKLTELREHLAQHQIASEAAEVALAADSVTDALLQYARQVGTDLLVMGAYGYPPLLEFVWGGTTQNLLKQTTIPTLLSR